MTPIPVRTSALPAWLPVSLWRVKQTLSLPRESVEDDDQIKQLILTAETQVEEDSDRIIRFGSFSYSFRRFPLVGRITLPIRNVTEAVNAVEVEYFDTDGNSTLFTDFTTSLGRVYPFITSESWPQDTEVGNPDAVVIKFDAGYNQAEVPGELQMKVIARVNALWSGCEGAMNVDQALSNRDLATYL